MNNKPFITTPPPPHSPLVLKTLWHYLTLEQKIVRNIWKREKSAILTKKDKNHTHKKCT